MHGWEEGDITVNDITLHYVRTGGDKPPVVLAHGFSDMGLCWTPVAEVLANDYDVIMVDARGHGRSDAPTQGYGPVEHAGDIHGVITTLGLRKPAVMGHSMGGATTYALASLYPDVPGAVIIEDAAPMIVQPRKAGEPDRFAGILGWIEKVKRQTPEEILAGGRAGSPRWSEAEWEPWVESKLRLSIHALNRADAAPIDWTVALPQITCPAMLLIADTDQGAGVTAERAAEVKEAVPQLEVVHIADAGHNIRRDQFDHFMAAVQPFLATWAAARE